MSNTAQSAMDTGVLMYEYDLQNLLTSARLPLSKADIAVNVFGRRDSESIASMRNGVLNVEGFRKARLQPYKQMVTNTIGPDDTPHIVTYSPEGERLHKQCNLIWTRQNSTELNAPYDNAVMLTSVFQATGGPRPGRILKGVRQDNFTTTPGRFVIHFDAVDANTNIAFKPATNVGIPSGFTTLATLAGGDIYDGIEALLGAMPSYMNRNVAATGTLALNAGSYTGDLYLTFDGAEPPQEVVIIDGNGAVVAFTVVEGYIENNWLWTNASAIELALDNGHLTASGFTAHLHCIGKTGNPATTATVKIRHSVDGAVWADLYTFPAINGLGKFRYVSPNPHVLVNRYLRVETVLSANDAQFALCVPFSRFGKVM